MDANLNIADLEEAVKLIDMTLDQGFLRGSELIRHFVEVRGRLEGFVKAVSASQLTTPDGEIQQTQS